MSVMHLTGAQIREIAKIADGTDISISLVYVGRYPIENAIDVIRKHDGVHARLFQDGEKLRVDLQRPRRRERAKA